MSSPPQPQKPILDRRLAAHFARRYNKSLTFQQLVDTPDGQGGSSRTWQVFDQTIGAIEPLSAQERLAQGAVGSTATHWIFRAYRSGITPAMRVQTGARVFDIHDVTDLGEQGLILQVGVTERFTT